MPKVYLAGPVTGLSFSDRNNWRENAISELAKYGIQGISPQRDKPKLASEIIPGDSDYVRAICGEKGIVVRDRYDVQTCDVLLVNLLGAKAVSIGTMIEYGQADAFRKPIITIIEPQGNIHDHLLVRELTGFRVETLEDGILVAKSILCC